MAVGQSVSQAGQSAHCEKQANTGGHAWQRKATGASRGQGGSIHEPRTAFVEASRARQRQLHAERETRRERKTEDVAATCHRRGA